VTALDGVEGDAVLGLAPEAIYAHFSPLDFHLLTRQCPPTSAPRHPALGACSIAEIDGSRATPALVEAKKESASAVDIAAPIAAGLFGGRSSAEHSRSLDGILTLGSLSVIGENYANDIRMPSWSRRRPGTSPRAGMPWSRPAAHLEPVPTMAGSKASATRDDEPTRLAAAHADRSAKTPKRRDVGRSHVGALRQWQPTPVAHRRARAALRSMTGESVTRSQRRASARWHKRCDRHGQW
jgi:hypothetical protein